MGSNTDSVNLLKFFSQDYEILKYIGCRKSCKACAFSQYDSWQTCVPLFSEENCHIHCHFHFFSGKSHFSAEGVEKVNSVERVKRF